MNVRQHQQLIEQVGQALAALAPPQRRQARAEYRAAGRHIELDLLVIGPDGVARRVRPPARVVRLFGALRRSMYRQGRGTWLGAVIQTDPAAGTRASFLIDHEPRWRNVPPQVGFADELREFPRDDEHIPDWLRQRAGLPAATPAGAGPMPAPTDPADMRTPRVWDRLDEGGIPAVDREPLPPAERDRVQRYLDDAPVVLAARSYDTDAFEPEREPSVPLNFRTDGTWVWPGAVPYYLREHDLPPDPDLLAHIRARRFTVPEVSEQSKERAVTAITG